MHQLREHKLARSRAMLNTSLDDLITCEDLAQALGVTVTALRMRVYRGTFPPPFSIPGSRRAYWRRSDVNAWLTSSARLKVGAKRRRVGRPRGQTRPENDSKKRGRNATEEAGGLPPAQTSSENDRKKPGRKALEDEGDSPDEKNPPND